MEPACVLQNRLVDEKATIERAEQLWSAGDHRAGLDLLLEHVRERRSDAVARRLLVDFYREMRAPDQAGRWGITLDGVITDFERDRLARMLAGSRVWGGDVSEILALPKGRRPSVVEDLVNGPVEEYWQRMRDRLPPHAVAPDPQPFVDASVLAWLASVGLLLAGLVALWIVAGLDLLDTRLFARALAALVAVSAGIALVLSGIVVAHEGKRSSAAWILGGSMLVIATVTMSVVTRLTFVL